MIRPTEKLDVDSEENFYIDKPREENTLEMAKLITEAENNNPALEDVKVEETADWIKNYYFAENLYTDCLHKASTAIYDKETKELVGVCLISLWQEWPFIGEISVKPSYQVRVLEVK